MIDYVHLTNFRKHVDYRADFSDGVNVFRAENEGGKTTILEGISYALFGARACRNSDFTTWGQPENSASVRVGIAGHTVTRAKKGAEVIDPDGSVIVTGQTEVTKWAEAQLGTTSALASSLMFSGQGSVRGALEKGSADASRMIEGLAGIDAVDNLIEKLQASLPTGATKHLRDSIEELEAELTALQEVDVADWEARVESAKVANDKWQDERAAVQVRLAAALQDLSEKTEKLAFWRNEKRTRDELARKLAEEKAQLATHMGEVGVITAELNGLPKAENLDELTAQLAAADEVTKTLALFDEFHGINYTGERVDQTPAQLDAQITALTGEIAALNNIRVDSRTQAAKLEASIMAGSCSFCGNDFSQVPEVIEKNRQANLLLDKVAAQGTDAEAKISQLTAQVASLRAIPRSYKGSDLPLRAKHLFAYEGEFTPPKVVLVPCALAPEPVDKYAISARIREAKQALATYHKLQQEKSRAEMRMASLQGVCDMLLRDFSRLPEATPAPVSDEDMQSCEALVTQYNFDIIKRTETINQHLKDLRAEVDLIERHKGAVNRKLDELAKENARLDTTEFNNKLLKDIRAAKPVLTKKLWDIVLTAVSHYASKMRGEDTLVKRAVDGFLVNGKPVDSYSGSALDVIGLAVRVALVKTFTPSANFIVLDEPFAACSDLRQASALSFLVGCGFGKVLLVTHEDVSESVAGNLITF